MTSFAKGTGAWTQYLSLPGLREVDFHWSDFRRDPREKSYDEAMDEVYEFALTALKEAFEDDSTHYVLLTHGKSTSRPGNMTARSVIRGLMRSAEATPYIDRKRCIQHESVFVAALRRRT